MEITVRTSQDRVTVGQALRIQMFRYDRFLKMIRWDENTIVTDSI
jgi:hypothetical protein